MKQYGGLGGKIISAIIITLLAAAAIGAGLGEAQAASITVTNINDSGVGSLRQAILDAMATPAADTITFNVSGTITLGSVLPSIVSTGGALTIDGTGQAVDISGNNSARIFFGMSGATLILRNLGLRHAVNSAIFSSGALVVDNCALTGNTSTFGGAIAIAGGSLTLSDSGIYNNNSTLFGGGIGISGGASLTMTNSSIFNNAASHGGGIFVYPGSALTITRGRIHDNSASVSGGGIVNNGTMTISTSFISGNSASSFGAGIYTEDASATMDVVNSTISGNTASVSGGGLAVLRGTVTLQNVTVAYNAVQSQGGCSNLHVQDAAVNIINSIMSNPVSGVNCCHDPGGTLASLGHNLDSEDTCGFNSTGDIINTDPLLEPLQSIGGPMMHALLNESPAIDAADGTACPATDQRGMARPQGNGCDIGSFEAIWYAIHTSISGANGSISCTPYRSMVGGSNPLYYIIERSKPVCVMTPNFNYHVSDVLTGPYGLPPVSVGPLWTYGFPNIQQDKTIQASFAGDNIWLFKGPGLPVNTITTTITAALTQAAADNDDQIRVQSGAYLEGFGVTCSGDFGGVTPKLSGGWASFLATDTKPTVIAPKLTITGACALIIDEITIQ